MTKAAICWANTTTTVYAFLNMRGEVNWYRVLELPPIAPPAV